MSIRGWILALGAAVGMAGCGSDDDAGPFVIERALNGRVLGYTDGSMRIDATFDRSEHSRGLVLRIDGAENELDGVAADAPLEVAAGPRGDRDFVVVWTLVDEDGDGSFEGEVTRESFGAGEFSEDGRRLELRLSAFGVSLMFDGTRCCG